jgi:L-alanine-DL-glutamate epimerase-like enolase superfamily enzyme
VRITGIRLRRLRYPLDPPFAAAWDPEPRRGLAATLVLVDTDEGLTGIGSGDTMDGFEPYVELFVGRDPLDIERHVSVLETIAFHAGRCWPLEVALWDLAGKAAGRPVADLLGGTQRVVPVYASTGTLLPPAERAEGSAELCDSGFRALKLRMARDRVDEGLATVAAVRETVGPDIGIMVDLNQGWQMPGDVGPLLGFDEVSRLAAGLGEIGITWFEEPLGRDDVAGLARLRAGSGTAIAGGELARTPAELDAYLAAGALDVYQPDAVLALGIHRAIPFAERVQAQGLRFTPHTWTNGIGLLANLHLAAGVGAGPFLEFPYDPPWWTPERRDFMLVEPIRPDPGGFLAVPDRPGLGVELDEDAVERYAVG